MKYRIVKHNKLQYVYELQRETLFGWAMLKLGSEDMCWKALENIKHHGTIRDITPKYTVLHEEDV